MQIDRPMMQLGVSAAVSLLSGRAPCEKFAEALHGIREELAASAQEIPQLARTLRSLRAAERLLRRPLRVALLGESNAGKSTLANLMLGNAVLPTLQLSNTRVPTLIRYAPQPSVVQILSDGNTRPLISGERALDTIICAAVGLPILHLRGCEIMDFPGFADPWLGYRSTDVARHRVDVSVWCTFSTQAWKESERAAWKRLPQRMRTHALLLGTSKDLLRAEQAEKVKARLEKTAGGDFHSVVLLSSMQARQALGPKGAVKDARLWQASGAADFFGGLAALLTRIRTEKLERVRAFANRIADQALDRLEAADPAV